MHSTVDDSSLLSAVISSQVAPPSVATSLGCSFLMQSKSECGALCSAVLYKVSHKPCHVRSIIQRQSGSKNRHLPHNRGDRAATA